MSTTYSDSVEAASSGEDGETPAALEVRPQPTAAPRGRGRLEISPRVVAKIAEVAASRVRGVQPVQSGGLSRVGGGPAGLPTTARVLGQTASVTMQVALGYPSPVRETCRQIREAVVRDCQRLAGVEVSRFDLEVVALTFRRSRDAQLRGRAS